MRDLAEPRRGVGNVDLDERQVRAADGVTSPGALGAQQHPAVDITASGTRGDQPSRVRCAAGWHEPPAHGATADSVADLEPAACGGLAGEHAQVAVKVR